jgi:2-methylcitrate dehydratase PrpD
MTGATVAETLSERIASVEPTSLPPVVRRVAGNLVLDVVGLCVAARQSDYVRAVADSGLAPGRTTAIGHARTFDAAGSALINGTAAHGEDFDDTFEGGPVHAGAVVVPAVLAVAEEFGADGLAALKGIAVGVETTCRLSLVAPTRVHKAGFHPTSVLGTMGATAAAGATLGLDAGQIAHALGIAGSMAGGIIEYLADGAWTKRLHAGWAAQSGIRAALLARAGFVGPRSVFEGTHGLFHGFARGASGDYAQLVDGFGARWVAETLAFKPFACGTMAHPYIDCAIRLARRGIAAEAIDEMVCEVAEGTVHRLWEPLTLKQAPPNPYAAKFSTPFCIAAGFILGDAGLGAFTEATVRDPRLRALAGKIRYVVDPANPYPLAYTGHIRAKLRSGEVVEERQPHLRGGAREPLSAAAIERKFMANAEFGGWSRDKAEAARALVGRLFDGPIDLMALRD